MVEENLRDVIVALSEKSKRLGQLDDLIGANIRTIERACRKARFARIHSVRLPDGADLGWSYDHRRQLWRFVVRTEDEVRDLLDCPREERVEAFSCGAMERLVRRMEGSRDG